MTAALMPHDAATIVVPYLAALMPDCTVSTRVQHRDRMVYVQQTGGSRADYVLDSALVIIQAYAPSVKVASEDCRAAFTHLMSIRDNPTYGRFVRSAEGFGLPGRFDDPDSNTPRYQATVQLHLRPLPTGVTP